MSIYHTINWFFSFSFLGYLLECAVVSYDNRKVVMNRGFGHGPFCIIYGFGALGACVALEPLSDRPIELFLASMAMATCMELVTAHVMARLFGSFWWDYSKKPLNYKGVICLESSIAWGFLGMFFLKFLNGFVYRLVGILPPLFERIVAVGILSFYVADFFYTLHSQRKSAGQEDDTPVVGRLKVY